MRCCPDEPFDYSDIPAGPRIDWVEVLHWAVGIAVALLTAWALSLVGR